MSRDDPEPEALARAMEAEGVPADYARDVLELWRTPRRTWRPCCGLLCDPCVLTLARVVDRLRAEQAT